MTEHEELGWKRIGICRLRLVHKKTALAVTRPRRLLLPTTRQAPGILDRRYRTSSSSEREAGFLESQAARNKKAARSSVWGAQHRSRAASIAGLNGY